MCACVCVCVCVCVHMNICKYVCVCECTYCATWDATWPPASDDHISSTYHQHIINSASSSRALEQHTHTHTYLSTLEQHTHTHTYLSTLEQHTHAYISVYMIATWDARLERIVLWHILCMRVWVHIVCVSRRLEIRDLSASSLFWWVLQHSTGFARLVWGRLRVHQAFIYSNWFVCSVCFCSLLPRLTLLLSFLDILHCLPRATWAHHPLTRLEYDPSYWPISYVRVCVRMCAHMCNM